MNVPGFWGGKAKGAARSLYRPHLLTPPAASSSRIPAREPIASALVFASNGKELIMSEHRQTTPSRKAAILKSPRKNMRKPAARKTSSRQRKASPKQASPRRWSQRVTKESDALDLKQGVFKLTDPKKIAASLKRSAERSSRRKTGAYRSALSMLSFYINRAGKTLPKTQRDRLQRAKTELRRQFHRE
jgi:hypothetical protein